MAMLFIAGMRTVVRDGLDYRKSVLVGIAFLLGFGFQNAPVLADRRRRFCETAWRQAVLPRS